MDAESVESIEDIEDEIYNVTEVPSWIERWKKLPMIPNKKRFIILAVVFSVIELAGLFTITYAFLGSNPRGLYDFAIFMMAPFTGLAISYIVENKKEAIGLSAINATSSILVFMIVYILIEHYLSFPVNLEFSYLSHLGIPLIFIVIQILIAFTMTRVRSLYARYGDSSHVRKSDQAMIDELREHRINRGIEEPEDDISDETKEDEQKQETI